jgi:ParB-like chromosome segregation protein Spo0J
MKQSQQRKVNELIPYINNSRTHSDAQVAQIAASIREFGWTNPILIDGENGIIAGHGRLKAAMLLNMAEVPVIELSHLSETQKKAYIIADNKLAMNADWDYEILKLEVENLVENDFDISVLGFDPSEFNENEVDYSVLDEDFDEKLSEMADGVRKAIQIEFEPAHFDEAQEVIKFWRQKDAYVGYMILDFLRKEKEKLK